MDDFRDQVRSSFSKCKSDIDEIQLENSKLKRQFSDVLEENNSLKNQMSEMKSVMSELQAEMKGIKIALDYIKEFNSNIQHQSQETQTISATTIQQETITQETQTQQPQQTPITQQAPKSQPRIEEPYTPPITDPYEALLAFKAKSNKREVLKNKLMQMVGENGMALAELKFLFVDHYRYCSKATFYNYLKEMELEKFIKVERENSKNFVYMTETLMERNLGR